MKKYVMLCTMVLCSLLLFGCGKYGEKDALKDLENQLKTKGYHLTGELMIKNNEDNYKYNVDVSYQKDNYYRVSLKNKTNNHEQLILRNEEGVYVLTPSLNKSFKFQSEWPFNSSQAYLLQTIFKDIKSDGKRKFKETDKEYIFTSKVNYTSNPNLINQKVYFDKKMKIKRVEVYNKDGAIQMQMKFKEIDAKATFKKIQFSLKENMSTAVTEEETKTVSKIDDIIYPMYIPDNTRLTSQDTLKKGSNGERVILTFSGEKPFMLIQETASREEELLTTPVFGEPEILTSSVAAVSDGSVSWMKDGIEYYAISDELTQAELLEVAKSVSVMPVGK